MNVQAVTIVALLAMATAVSAQEQVKYSIRGRVRFSGEVPKPRMIECTGRWCDHGPLPVEDLVVDKKTDGLKNAFVWVKRGAPESPQPKESVLMDIQGHRFTPRVCGVRTGQKLVFSARHPHECRNIHGLPKESREFNFTFSKEGSSAEWSFEKPERAVRIRNDIQTFMVAWVHVLDHSYFAVSDAKGDFVLPPLPAGDYEVAAWHELFGESASQKVTVADKEPAPLEFVFEKK